MSAQPIEDRTIRCPECGHTLGRWVSGRIVSTHQGRTWFGNPEGIACEQKGCHGVWRRAG